jgi:hypothetical protein
MKNFLPNSHSRVLVIFLLVFSSFANSFGQIYVRSYATRQTTFSGGVDLLGSFNNLGNAVDGNPQTASSYNLGVGVGAYREQVVDFNAANSTAGYATTIAANTPITIKVDLPAGLLGLLSGIEVQAVTGLARSGDGSLFNPYVWAYSNVGTSYTNAAIAGLVSGAGSTEITITPTAAYQGVRVRISGLLNLAFGVSFYDAYIKVPATGNVACANRIDVLSGVKAGTVVGGIANATGSVSNPWNVVDASLTTYAQVMTGIQLLSQAYHTTIFNTPSKVGDTLKVLYSDPNNSILELALLNGFKINLYNGSGTVPAQTIINTSSLLTLRVLDSATAKAYIVAVPTVVFDRVEIVIGGVANAFSELNVYDVNRENAGVTLTAAQANIYVYAGQNFTLGATSITDDPVVFYDAATNGNIVPATTIASTTGQAGTVLSYYAGTTRNGCTETSKRKQINVHVVGINQNYPLAGIVDTAYISNIKITLNGTLPLTPAFKYVAQSALPVGLSLNQATGGINGTPTTPTSGSFFVAITDTANALPVGTFLYIIPITTSGVPLNSSLVSLSCNGNAQQINVSWVTVSETNNKGFSIEKSLDGRNFKTIGFVNSQYATGTGNSKLQYTFADLHPQAGVNYYRLNQMDFSGKAQLSDVVSVTIGQTSDASVYPNPVADVLNIRAAQGTVVYIYNAMGQLVATPRLNADSNIAFDTKNLANGLYTVKVVSNNTTVVKNIVVKH